MSISKEELIQLRDLANKMLGALEEPVAVEEKPKRGRKKVEKKTVAEPVEKQEKPALKIPKAKDVLPTFDDEEVDEKEFVRGNKRRESSKTEARCEPFRRDPNRPNEFEKMIKNRAILGEVNKELAKAKGVDDSISFRLEGERPNNLVEVECSVCGKEEVVNAGLVTDWRRYKCNGCIKP